MRKSRAKVACLKKEKRAAIPLGDDKQAATERSPPPLAGVSAIACFTFCSVARA